jgi:hypothetical protein
LLLQAEQAFAQALQSPAPESANIPAKVSFGLGLIHRVKAVASQSNAQSGSGENPQGQPGSFSEELDMAQSKFQEVVDAYRLVIRLGYSQPCLCSTSYVCGSCGDTQIN